MNMPKRRIISLFLFALAGCSGAAIQAPEPGSNADLSSLVLSNGTLNPTFDPGVTSYTAELSDSGVSVTVTATAVDSGASITVQDHSVPSGTPTDPIPVRPATMTIAIDVAASDGVTQKSYEVVVQLRGWQIDETNTGLAGVGVDKNSLPDYSGPNPIPAGSTISMKKLTDPDVSAGNITFDRCWIVVAGWGMDCGSANGSVTFQDCDIEETRCMATDLFNSGPVTLSRCSITGGSAGASMSEAATIQQCYVHDLMSSCDNHVDGVTRRIGTAQVNYIDNHIDATTNPNHTTAAVYIEPTFGFIDNLSFQGNLLENNFPYNTVVLENKSNGYGTNLVMDNNRLYPNGSGYSANYGNGGALGWGQWANNYINDPSQPDNKGAVVSEPTRVP
jgi:hypothetical protein